MDTKMAGDELDANTVDLKDSSMEKNEDGWWVDWVNGGVEGKEFGRFDAVRVVCLDGSEMDDIMDGLLVGMLEGSRVGPDHGSRDGRPEGR